MEPTWYFLAVPFMILLLDSKAARGVAASKFARDEYNVPANKRPLCSLLQALTLTVLLPNYHEKTLDSLRSAVEHYLVGFGPKRRKLLRQTN